MALSSYYMRHTAVFSGIMLGGKKLRVVLGLHMCPLAKELMIHFVVYILVPFFNSCIYQLETDSHMHI